MPSSDRQRSGASRATDLADVLEAMASSQGRLIGLEKELAELEASENADNADLNFRVQVKREQIRNAQGEVSAAKHSLHRYFATPSYAEAMNEFGRQKFTKVVMSGKTIKRGNYEAHAAVFAKITEDAALQSAFIAKLEEEIAELEASGVGALFHLEPKRVQLERARSDQREIERARAALRSPAPEEPQEGGKRGLLAIGVLVVVIIVLVLLL